MPFALWMIGFLAVMAIFVWAAVVMGVPQIYLALAIFILLVTGASVAAGLSRRRRRRFE